MKKNILRLKSKFTLFRNNYSLIIEVIVNLLEAFEHKPKSLDTEVPEDGEVNDMEYNDPYCKLMNAQHNEPFAAEVINIKSKEIYN